MISNRYTKTKAERKAIVKAVLKLRSKGQTLETASRSFGIRYQTFYNWALEAGIDYPKVDTWRSRRMPPDERRSLATELVRSCATGGSINQVSRRYGVSRIKLLEWVDEYGLAIDPTSPGAKGYSRKYVRSKVDFVIRLMRGGSTFSKACSINNISQHTVHKSASAVQQEQIQALITSNSYSKKAQEVRTTLRSVSEELEELFSSSEPLGWE